MTLNIPPPQPSVSERRGQRLAPLQTNFSRPTSHIVPVPSPRPQRPRPEDYQNDSPGGERIPLQRPPVKRHSSRPGLRGMFSREKPARVPSNDTRLLGINEVHDPVPPVISPSVAPNSPGVPMTPKTTASTPTVASTPKTMELPRDKVLAKPPLRPSGEAASAGDVVWKPPPLFQAYPQAIKHDSLPAPSLSADTILRMAAGHSHKGDTAEEINARKKKEEKEKKKHMRSLSETIGKADWTEKVFVLATSGYIMQYSGGGKYDRLPEKMLQLGPKSVAFASDAIPGKHWVLQVSQTSDENDPAPADTTRPRFSSRFGFHRSHARRLARSFLLVFNSPEDMSSWLLAVRAQIEARGGKKYVSEKVYDDGMEQELQSKPSMRQMVHKDPNRFSQIYLRPQHSTTFDDTPAIHNQQSTGLESGPNHHEPSRQSSYVSLRRQSIVNQPTPDSRPQSSSTNQTEFTSPPNSSGRFYAATSSIPSSSVPNSPPAQPPPPPPPPPEELYPKESAIETVLSSLDAPARSPVMAPRKRQSMFLSQSHTAPDVAEMPRAQSTVPDPVFRSASPPAPNFSVPSFSRRFGPRPGPQQFPHGQRPIGLHREESNNDLSDSISTLTSPAQSPVRSVASGRTDWHEPPRGYQDSPIMKTLRGVGSQDSLGGSSRNVDPRAYRASRVPPMANIMAAATPPQSVHSLATVNDGHPSFDSPFAPPLPPEHREPVFRREQQQQRPRDSVLYQGDPNRAPPAQIPMSRRKSMPGLAAVGPPTMPPPTCPLPKIPSPVPAPAPVDPSSPPILPELAHLRGPVPLSAPPKDTRTRQKPFVGPAPAPAHNQYVPQGPPPPPPGTRSVSSRHTRVANGM